MTLLYAFIVGFIIEGQSLQWDIQTNDCVAAYRFFQAHFPDAHVKSLTCIKLPPVQSPATRL